MHRRSSIDAEVLWSESRQSLAVSEEQRRDSADLRGRPARPTIRDSEGKVRVGKEVAGPLALPITGGRVEQCGVDTALSLMLEVSERWWSLRLEGSFVLAPPPASSGRFEFGENEPPSAWAPALDILLHNSVTAGNVATDGTLELTFADGYRLDVPPSRQWEAWQLNGPEGELFVGGPGGQVARWPAQADADPG